MRESSVGRHMLFPTAYYGANAVLQGYMSLFYTSLGFDSARLGGINAATALTAMAMQPLWGGVGDRARSRRRTLIALCLLSAGSMPLALTARGFLPQCAAAMLFYAFFCALQPMGDAILLDADASHFGAFRLCGGAGYALFGALMGAFIGIGGEDSVIWAACLLLALTAVAAAFLPPSPGKRRGRPAGMRALLRDRALVRLLLLILPVQITMGFFFTFYAPHFLSLKGATGALLGLGFAVATVCEAPYLLLSTRIYRRFGAEVPMCAAACVLALRWLLLGSATGVPLALASQILHGGGMIVLSVSAAQWINDHVPESLRTTGQSLLQMVFFGASRIIGNLLGGVLAQRIGSARVFRLAAALCLMAAGANCAARRHSRNAS